MSDSLLTERERAVLSEMAAGKTDAQIARVLQISEHTVGGHAKEIFRKLGVDNRTGAAREALRRGLIE